MFSPRLASAVLLCVAVTGCGHDGPTGPTGNNVVDVAGVWRGTLTETTYTGGECLAPILAQGVGASAQVSVAFNQNGANLSATATQTGNGGSETFGGTAGQSSVLLTWQSCTSCNRIGAVCSNGASRDLRKQTGALNASVNGGTMTGTYTENYNVVVTSTQAPVGTLSFTYTFALTRQ